ncbi:Panacea domain-containing protein [Turneriella parva]|uniref:Antitoxin SocA-like Panacea domain-containing protein n=1 Tax=Turneriella parva (strain ATCC BAA-1111 / DSM 21527 / NCTC 11395 / H) TaxID=869212 RepID=I4B9T9_TURPD|nr:Panacea domain-containing protein [Turneriella parva]AFM14046.1 hypothetical protein Turpa_3409 [Turneriella parva DSM 21527]
MVSFEFDEKRVSQVCAHIIQKSKGRINYTKLLKILYLIDREALKLWNHSLTGDTPVSMDNGPVLSRIYNHIKGVASSTSNYWSQFISTDGYDVRLMREPEVDEISPADLEIIDSVYEIYKDYPYTKLIDICHELPEWVNPNGSSTPIYFETIFKHLQKDEALVKSIDFEQQSHQKVKKILNC